jgi:hypothetical protein
MYNKENRMSEQENTQASAPEAAEAPIRSEMAEQIAALSAEAEAPTDLSDLNEALADDTELDVPASDFWDNEESAPAEVAEEPEAEESTAVEEEAPAQDVSEEPVQTITFKANGQEQEITLEEARQKLAMAEGGAQAFTKLAQANKRVKEFEKLVPELQQKAALLEKLEEVKHDPEAIIKIATGKDPQEFMAEYLRKQRILETGSDAEKAQLEKEERLAKLERELEVERAEREAFKKAEQERQYTSERDSLKSMMESEFFKHKVDLGSDIDSNAANEYLWHRSQQQMAKYVKKYQDHPKFKELLPKMAQKSFEDVAGTVKRITTGSVQAKVDEAIKQKKQKAAEKAAVASTRRMSDPDSNNFAGLSVREIADKLVGKKKFSW